MGQDLARFRSKLQELVSHQILQRILFWKRPSFYYHIRSQFDVYLKGYSSSSWSSSNSSSGQDVLATNLW